MPRMFAEAFPLFAHQTPQSKAASPRNRVQLVPEPKTQRYLYVLVCYVGVKLGGAMLATQTLDAPVEAKYVQQVKLF